MWFVSLPYKGLFPVYRRIATPSGACTTACMTSAARCELAQIRDDEGKQAKPKGLEATFGVDIGFCYFNRTGRKATPRSSRRARSSVRQVRSSSLSLAL